MNNSKIIKELESLSEEFKLKIQNHFISQGFEIYIENFDLSIREEKKDHPEKRNGLNQFRCYINAQGQIVCQ